MNKILIIILITMSLVTTAVVSTTSQNITDFDPLTDNIEVTVEIQKIRSLEKFDIQIHSIEKIDWFSDPDFYVKVFINDEEFTSDVWRNTKYIYDPQWSATCIVPSDDEFVDIKIQLWDWNIGLDKLCDISSIYDNKHNDDSFDVELKYSIKTGHWYGDDFVQSKTYSSDPSGYGRLNGCDDGSIYQRERDCELWFDIYQTDPDGDGIPYWTEVNVYGTDPEIDNTGEDFDGDGCPIEWEHKWGHYYWYDHHDGAYYHEWIYDVNSYDDHSLFDLDNDGLDNVEEYKTSQWGSDPFRKDLFVELDLMEGGLDKFPEGAKELLYTAYNRQNIVYHLDDGSWNESGSEIIPFDELTDYSELNLIHNEYFLHGDKNNWRRGVFHYGVIVYQAIINGCAYGTNRFQLSSNGMEEKAKMPLLNRDIVYASAYMHETGHTLGIFHGNTPGCDDQQGKYPWQKNWWKWRPYKSVMNYGYMYKMLDYSDGSRGRNDFDDWNNIDLTFFQKEFW